MHKNHASWGVLATGSICPPFFELYIKQNAKCQKKSDKK
jgi:hypothetical protein